tara:strand:+ start:164 stop:1159 length:996 start_codon:yes stop_codon:yes gene_type:complete
VTKLLREGPCVYLSGGVGGAKLALGLSSVLDPSSLMIVANTGDDFEHLGLTICPDIDTLAYTLGGVANTDQGWGREDETDSFMSALADLGGETWFFLGDRDLATHIERSVRLASGETLTSITAGLCSRLGVRCQILPMSDDPVRTLVNTSSGLLEFQHYFVRDRCEPRVLGFRFMGAEQAEPNAHVLRALSDSTLRCVIIGPSNPYISIDPILALPGLMEALKDIKAPIIAVSPIISGRAIKGPTAKMMRELGLSVSVQQIVKHYEGLIDGIVVDTSDVSALDIIDKDSIEVRSMRTLMSNLEDRAELARSVLKFADYLSYKCTGALSVQE